MSDAKWQLEHNTVVEFLNRIVPQPSLILDAPIGTGRFLAEYARSGHSVVGIDVSPDMLSEATALLEAAPADGVALALGNLACLPLSASSVDVAVCIRLLNLVPLESSCQFIAELGRVSSGYLIVGIREYDPASAPYQWFNRTRARMQRSALKVIPHPVRAVRAAFEKQNLTIVDDRLIAVAKRRSSHYRIFLLRK